MSILIKSEIIKSQLQHSLGDVLVFLRPNKARQLSENRITLIHKNKKNLSIQERLMRYSR